MIIIPSFIRSLSETVHGDSRIKSSISATIIISMGDWPTRKNKGSSMQGGKNLKNDTVVGKVKPLDAFLPSRKGYVGQGRVIPRKTYHIFVISMVVI